MITWPGSIDSSGFTVKRSTTSGGPYSAVSPLLTGTTAWLDSGLGNGLTYYYVVTAEGSQGDAVTSAQAAVTSGSIAAPTGLSASPGSNQVALTWNAVPGAAAYNVKRSLVSGSGYSIVGAAVTGVSFTDTPLINGTNYYYVVSALSALGLESSNSLQVSAVPDPVADPGFETPVLTGSSYQYNPAGTPWTFTPQSGDNGSGITANHSAFNSLNAGAPEGVQVAFLQGTGALSQVIYGLVPGGSYTLTFSASQRQNVQHGGQGFNIALSGSIFATFTPSQILQSASTYSTYTASFTAPAASGTLAFSGTSTADNTVFLDKMQLALLPPSAPAGLSGTDGLAQVTLGWPASPGATAYNVKRSAISGSGYGIIAPGLSGSTYTDFTVLSGSAYYYVVTATNAAGESAPSPQLSAVIPPTPPVLSGSAGNAMVAFNWTRSGGATGYNLKRGVTSGGPYGTMVITNTPATSGTDASVANETTYYYVVSALNAGGEGLNSPEVAARPVLPLSASEMVPPVMVLAGGVPQFTINSVIGRTYQLLTSTTLAPGSWVNVGSSFGGTGAPLIIRDTYSPGGAVSRFYKLLITP